MGGIAELSPVYLAVVHYQRNEYDECIEICSKVLEKNPYDEAVWSLKTRALTAQVMKILSTMSYCSIDIGVTLYFKLRARSNFYHSCRLSLMMLKLMKKES